jgi:DNA-binding transcriptional regulator YdaS (Cro superfamily)
MTPDDLKLACDRAGGVYALARMIGKWPKYLYRRINGDAPVSRMDALAVQKAVEILNANEQGDKR